MHLRKLQNNRTKFTRMCIGEAIIVLLEKKSIGELKVLSVARKAGISRMTFYKHYDSIRAALEDYLQIIISEYLEEIGTQADGNAFLQYEHILFALRFFDRYRQFFLTMQKQGLYDMLISSVNRFMTLHLPTDRELSVYKQYAYGGALLNTFLMWEQRGKTDRVEDVAKMLFQLYGEANI